MPATIGLDDRDNVPEVYISFSGDSPIRPLGLERLGVGDQVTVMMQGTVKDISRSEYEDSETRETRSNQSLGLQVVEFKAAPIDDRDAATARALYPGMKDES